RDGKGVGGGGGVAGSRGGKRISFAGAPAGRGRPARLGGSVPARVRSAGHSRRRRSRPILLSRLAAPVGEVSAAVLRWSVFPMRRRSPRPRAASGRLFLPARPGEPLWARRLRQQPAPITGSSIRG